MEVQGTAEGEPFSLAQMDALVALAKQGTQRVDVVCPGFVSDCLETLEEIAIEARRAFIGAGGKEFHALPCLNEAPEWIVAMARIAADR